MVTCCGWRPCYPAGAVQNGGQPPGRTLVCGPQADVRLEGLEAHHGEIRRDERDEYVYINVGSGPPAG